MGDYHDKKSFFRNDVENIALTDYTSDLALVAVTGEFGFGRVVGVGEYYLEPDNNMAEVSFSISNDFQGKRLGKILLRKLAEAAMENGISGLRAYVSPGNKQMVRLFKSLPYAMASKIEADMLVLSCRFLEEP